MTTDWDDLRYFLTLARSGTLAAAARQLGVSHPTVARRIKALEDKIRARLFDRLPDHFVLTAAGEQLMEDAEAMERSALSIERRSAGLNDTQRGTVRISAGESMTGFLAQNLPRLREGLQCVEYELATSHTLANLSRREADLMIRDQVPDLASLVTRRLGHVAYAVYGRKHFAEGAATRQRLKGLPWIGFDDDHTYMPGGHWLRLLLDDARPAIRATNWLIVHEAVASGAGVAVLPCHMGDGDPMLVRIGPVLDEVSADQFLLVHHDLHHLPRVRAVMDAIVALFGEQRAALEGRPGAASRAA